MKLTSQSKHNKSNQSLLILSALGLSFIFMVGCYYKSIHSQQFMVGQNNDKNRLALLSDKTQDNLLEVGSFIKNFQITHESNGLIKIDEKISDIRKNLIEIKTIITAEEDKNFVAEMENKVASYQNDFYTVTKVTTEIGVTVEGGLLNQFNKKMQNVSTIANNSKDTQLREKFLLMQNLQKNYLADENSSTTAEQVIVAQKNFLDRVNRSTGDYGNVSKMMVQTISLMQNFDLLKTSFEQKKTFSKKVADSQLLLESAAKQLASMSYKYETKIQQLITDTEQQDFILFLISIILVSIGFIISALILTQNNSANFVNSEEDKVLQKLNMTTL